MNDYLLQIENEFSRGAANRRLSPLDWNLAQRWWDSGIPLHVVLGAMAEAFEKNAANGKRPINNLRYFADAVEQRFDLWKQNQVGKSPAVLRTIPGLEEIMNSLPIAVQTANINENARILTDLADALPNIIAPEPLASAIKHLRGELFALADEAAAKQLTSDHIESRLTALSVLLEPNLIVSIDDDERAAIIAQTRAEYGKFHLMPGAEHKVLIRKLYDRFGLPELTLFAL